MKTKLMALLLTLAWTLPSFGATKAYLADDGGFFYRPTLYVDGKKHEIGWARYDMAESMKSNPEAYAHALAYENNVKKSQIAVWLGVGAAVTYLAVTPREHESDSIYWGIFALGFIPSMYFMRQAQGSFMDAMNSYNGVVRQNSTDLKLDFFVLPSDQPQVGLRLEF